jgi:hypothetical protein
MINVDRTANEETDAKRDAMEFTIPERMDYDNLF